MRGALVLIFAIVSPRQWDRGRSKLLLRRAAIWLCRRLLGLLSRPYAMREGMTVVFSPHQDDETLGCGGLIARKRNEGLPVHVIFITDGSGSHPNHPTRPPAEIGRIRHQEARAALAILGVESVAIHFLDEPDGTLGLPSSGRRELLVARIAALLQQIRPTEIFLPCNPDASTEHEAAFNCVLTALQQTDLRPEIWQYPIWSWLNPLLLSERLVKPRKLRHLDAEDFLSIKGKALACYHSQIEPLPPEIEPALPKELLRVFKSDTEFFIRYSPAPQRSVPPPEASHPVI
jgi:N-acetylglucosamine malate deacetylase 1